MSNETCMHYCPCIGPCEDGCYMECKTARGVEWKPGMKAIADHCKRNLAQVTICYELTAEVRARMNSLYNDDCKPAKAKMRKRDRERAEHILRGMQISLMMALGIQGNWEALDKFLDQFRDERLAKKGKPSEL